MTANKHSFISFKKQFKHTKSINYFPNLKPAAGFKLFLKVPGYSCAMYISYIKKKQILLNIQH